MTKVCLDANIWIKVLTEEPDSNLAEKLIQALINEYTQIIAPDIMIIEVGSILRKKHNRKLIPHDALIEYWHLFRDMPIKYKNSSDIYQKAWEIAEENHLTHLYDAVYLAVSEGIPFWTADERLVNSIKPHHFDIRLLKKDIK